MIVARSAASATARESMNEGRVTTPATTIHVTETMAARATRPRAAQASARLGRTSFGGRINALTNSKAAMPLIRGTWIQVTTFR